MDKYKSILPEEFHEAYHRDLEEFQTHIINTYGVYVNIVPEIINFNSKLLIDIINKEIAEKFKGKYTGITDKKKTVELRTYRQIFTKISLDNGFNQSMIAGILEKNHATIHNCRKQASNYFDNKDSEFLSVYYRILNLYNKTFKELK